MSKSNKQDTKHTHNTKSYPVLHACNCLIVSEPSLPFEKFLSGPGWLRRPENPVYKGAVFESQALFSDNVIFFQRPVFFRSFIGDQAKEAGNLPNTWTFVRGSFIYPDLGPSGKLG